MLVAGPGDDWATLGWDAAWRASLVERLRLVTAQLWAAGIERVFIDGSFVEDKAHPNDIDGYFDVDARRIASGELLDTLNRLDPLKSWTWDHSARRASRGSPKLQLPMWHAYRVEIYPHYSGLIAGRDEHGQPLKFPAFFGKCRGSGAPKGIVRLIPPKEIHLP
jgi:hypothetical protein